MSQQKQAPLPRQEFQEWLENAAVPVLVLQKGKHLGSVVKVPATPEIDYLFGCETFYGERISWSDRLEFCGLYDRQHQALHLLDDPLPNFVSGLTEEECQDSTAFGKRIAQEVDRYVEAAISNERSRLSVRELTSERNINSYRYYKGTEAGREVASLVFSGEKPDVQFHSEYYTSLTEDTLLSYDNDKTAVLNLPAADAGIWRAVEKVDAASVDECAFRCVDCLIPFLRDAINNAIDDEDGIEQADEFAKRLAQIEREWPESDMVKYKALLSVVDHPSLQDATRLMGEIDQYELRPEVAQTWGYAEMMFREKYSALPEELFQTPQAAQIGQKMLDDRLGVITEYGLIRRKDGQPFPVFQPEQEIGQGLEMM